ncbi:MAG: hypothetical protein ACREMW_08855 [Gemmatimonadales bacterium]
MNSSTRLGARIAMVTASVVLGVLACTEEITSPASCPDFCPSGQIVTVETLLTTAISRDSTFRGYVEAHRGNMLLAATLPSLDSRPIFQTEPIAPRLRINTTTSDTTTGPIVVDSTKLTFTLLRRDSAAHNLRLVLYRLPLGLDSTSTFAGTDAAFGGTPIRAVNLDSLFAAPGGRDSVTGDSVLRMDSVRHSVTFSLKFDTTQLPFVVADSGRLALGVRVTADGAPSAAFGASDAGVGPEIAWFIRVDSAGTLLERPFQRRLVRFDTFVFDPPPVALDSNLIVGGVPAARALLRIALPRAIRDSSQIIRATLILVPVAPVPATPPDSFFLMVNHVAADLGAKSPIATDTIAPKSALFGPGLSDTVQIEVTSLLRFWQFDTTSATAVYLRLLALDRVFSTELDGSEASTFTALRLYSSRTPAFRPALRLTFSRRFRFGEP